MQIVKWLCAVIITFLPVYGLAIEINPVPGGIAAVPMDSQSEPEAYFERQRVAMLYDNQQWKAMVGLPLSLRGRTQNLYMKEPVQKRMRFRTDRTSYKIQRLTINNLRLIEPLESDKGRIEKEAFILKKTFATWTDGKPFQQNYIAPIRGWISSTFGLKRFFNGVSKPPHTGLDIAADTGEVIVAAGTGQVLTIGDFFYTGKTVIVNHGQGVMMLYAHLSKVLLKEGQLVKRGEALGLVGQTGRTTGPHLHWAVVMNQTYVDPLLFVNRQSVLPIINNANRPNKAKH